jgi:hypothetical protein
MRVCVGTLEEILGLEERFADFGLDQGSFFGVGIRF